MMIRRETIKKMDGSETKYRQPCRQRTSADTSFFQVRFVAISCPPQCSLMNCRLKSAAASALCCQQLWPATAHRPTSSIENAIRRCLKSRLQTRTCCFALPKDPRKQCAGELSTGIESALMNNMLILALFNVVGTVCHTHSLTA